MNSKILPLPENMLSKTKMALPGLAKLKEMASNKAPEAISKDVASPAGQSVYKMLSKMKGKKNLFWTRVKQA